LIATPATAADVIGDLTHAISIRNRRASEFLNDESHGEKGYRPND
jgi:hypothetical protein